MQELLTIITPCDPNRADFLPETSKSVEELRSDLPSGWSLEWLVCFDGPTRESYGDRCFELPVQTGVSAARNACLEQARGSIVVPLDADDLIVSEGVLKAIEALSELDGPGWVATNRLDLASGKPTKHWHGDRSWEAGEFFHSSSERPLPFHPNSVLVATELAREVGGWPEEFRFGEDFLFAAKVSELAAGRSISEVAHLYRSWNGQTVASEEFSAGYETVSSEICRELEAFRLERAIGC